jgi:hypothetical protein
MKAKLSALTSTHSFLQRLALAILLLVSVLTSQAALTPFGTEFTYQGRLNDASGGASGRYDFRFALQDAASGGTPIVTVTNLNVVVSNGLFTTQINFGANIFIGYALWLDIGVRSNGTASAFTTLAPRQPITPTPNAHYASLAATVPGGSITSSKLGVDSVTTSALQNNAVTGAKIANGQVVKNLNGLHDAVVLAAGANASLTTNGNTLTVAGSSDWKLGGNGGTTPAANFIGTTDNQPLAIKVNGTTALRIDPTAYTPNIIGGLGGFIPTVIGANVRGAVVAGGNAPAGPVTGSGGGDFHAVYDSDGAIGGGFGNKVGTDNADPDDAPFATVGGGVFNGAANYAATVAGGDANFAGGFRSSIGGGYGNQATGPHSMISGGANNVAAGEASFAAGQRAKALHNGSFVWADSYPADFASTANDQFNIRAAGGVRAIGAGLLSIGTDNGVQGNSSNPFASGVYGENSAQGFGVAGRTTGGGSAVFGDNADAAGWAGNFNGNVYVGGNEYFGTQVRQMLNLWSTAYGIGVQASTLYFRTDNFDPAGGFAWYKGGTHHNGAGNPGGGQTLMNLDNAGTLSLPLGDVRLSAGRTISSSGRLHVQANESLYLNPFAGAGAVIVGGGGGPGDLTVLGNLSANSFTPNGIGMPNNFGPNPAFAAPGQYIAFGHPGVSEDFIGYRDNTFFFKDSPGGGDTCDPTVEMAVLRITGGCDLAEPFQMSHTDIPSGAVVIIDEEHPGQLKMSEGAYDNRVAGIVSGANGVKAGITLHQEGLIEGGQNVALTGRVYAQADASNGAIKPGDLLTTSDTPGYAMKVTDHAKAQGAILGKAMTGLKEGKGMVLVLVTLQ